MRKALEYGAYGIDAADRTFAPAYLALANDAIEKASSEEEYNLLMEGPNSVVYSLESAKAALLSAEAGLDLWEKKGDSRAFLASAKYLFHQLVLLRDGMEKLGVGIPEELNKAIEMAEKVI